ncbi:MAG: hypothetical protein LBO82_05115 [Synergistaceae bacterium]|jgi:hypothetical protein|nr:hypothetical protein [Synergistaceae bacterium]
MADAQVILRALEKASGLLFAELGKLSEKQLLMLGDGKLSLKIEVLQSDAQQETPAVSPAAQPLPDAAMEKHKTALAECGTEKAARKYLKNFSAGDLRNLAKYLNVPDARLRKTVEGNIIRYFYPEETPPVSPSPTPLSTLLPGSKDFYKILTQESKDA